MDETRLRLGRDLIRRALEAANADRRCSLSRPTAAHNLITNLLVAGDPLADVQREAESGLEFAQKPRFGLVDRHDRARSLASSAHSAA